MVLATVVCITYNHAKYISKALDSILQQITNFEFQILVHDDASTDGTVEILKEYKQKYPEKIQLILEKTNQYSKDPLVLSHICFPRIFSKYIAICEGDDYWCADNKLQLQIDLMEKDESISMTCCNSYTVTQDGDIIKVINPFKNEGFIPAKEIINSARSMVSTCTIAFKTDVLKKRKEYYDQVITEDYPLEVLCATNGRVYYLKEPMGCYRVMVPGSWSERIRSKDSYILVQKNCIVTSNFLLDLNRDTNGKYKMCIYLKVAKYLYRYKIADKEESKEYSDVLLRLPFLLKLLIPVVIKLKAWIYFQKHKYSA